MEGPNQKKMQMIVESPPSEKKHFLKKEITQMLRPSNARVSQSGCGKASCDG